MSAIAIESVEAMSAVSGPIRVGHCACCNGRFQVTANNFPRTHKKSSNDPFRSAQRAGFDVGMKQLPRECPYLTSRDPMLEQMRLAWLRGYDKGLTLGSAAALRREKKISRHAFELHSPTE